MSQFAREDRRGAIDLVSDRDVIFEADRDQDGVGDLVFKTGGVERARIDHAGVGTGLLGGSIAYVGLPSGDTSGVTDRGAIQAALDAANVAGGGVVRLGEGVYLVSQALILYANVILEGAGSGATTIRLAANANDDVIRSSNFESLTGGASTGGIGNFGIVGLSVDGNKANQSFGQQVIAAVSGGQTLPQATIYLDTTANLTGDTGSVTLLTTSGVQTITYSSRGTDGNGNFIGGCSGGAGTLSTSQHVYQRGYGVRLYGYDFRIRDLQVKSCVTDGLYTEWGSGNLGSGTFQMESVVADSKFAVCNRNGVTFHGPHDSAFRECWGFQNSNAGFETGNSATSYWTQCHAWGSPQIYSWDDHTSTFRTNCVAEVTSVTGGRGVRFAAGAGAVCTFDGGEILGSGGANGVEILNSSTGIRVRTSSLNVATPLVITSDGGYNDFEINAHFGSSSAVALVSGSPSSNTRVVVRPGRNCTASPFDTDRFASKGSGSGIAPSATLNTYGAATTIAQSGGNLRASITLTQLQLTSGGTFGAETLTVRVTATYQDGTNATLTHTFTSAGSNYTLTTADIYTLLANNKQIVSLAIDCQSTINSSTATAGYFYAGQR